MACTWAGSAPPWRSRVAKGPKSGDVGVVSCGEHGLVDAGVGERAVLPGPGGAGVAAAHVQPRWDQLAGGPGQRDGADFVAG
jgi:hypothetical protein